MSRRRSGQPTTQAWPEIWCGAALARNVEFPGLAYCSGGKSLYWGAWCLRLTVDDLQQWPTSTAQYLTANYTDVEVRSVTCT